MILIMKLGMIMIMMMEMTNEDAGDVEEFGDESGFL